MSVYDMCGNYYLATSSLASGVGVLKEKYAPYQNSEGALDKEGDWSLPEDMRFWESYELKDANVLPAPARRDADGNYVYRPEGAEAIKGELLKGRAVGISFLADQSRPVQTPEEMRASMEKNLAGNISVSAAEKAAYIDARVGATDLESLSKAELEDLVRLRCRLNGLDEDLYDMDALKPDELIRIFRSDYFSKPYDELVKLEEEAAEQVPYMSFVGGDPVIYAQYTYEAKAGNHAVCVVGWDDTFPASSFREGYQPPADGCWRASPRPSPTRATIGLTCRRTWSCPRDRPSASPYSSGYPARMAQNTRWSTPQASAKRPRRPTRRCTPAKARS